MNPRHDVIGQHGVPSPAAGGAVYHQAGPFANPQARVNDIALQWLRGQDQAGLPANPRPEVASPQLALFANLLREAGPNRQPEAPNTQQEAPHSQYEAYNHQLEVLNPQPNVVADAQPVASYPGYVRNAFGDLDWVGLPAPPASPEPPVPPAPPAPPVAYPGYGRNPFRNPGRVGFPAAPVPPPLAPPVAPVAGNMPPPGAIADQDEEGQRLFRQATAALEALVAYENNRANRFGGGGPHQPPM